MVSVKTPINTENVKERAARNLSRFSSRQRNKNVKTITGDIVKPIHLSKSEPLVRRMTSYQKNN
ncbi:hypothetical protein KD050_00345 [Psychrobacillus sp. INOP01]|uniref:hypothetical protein n=1 Tax=Psychrobacillus sp. INOP01 TaxID=2829187 RepID=UPI001BABCC80|nr:hypothetical protein [Psychrobacillus sp. INOP01]QUG41789.1 hypothetical protein KD050_00345 [Psychrobacillus sp. INOP01]